MSPIFRDINPFSRLQNFSAYSFLSDRSIGLMPIQNLSRGCLFSVTITRLINQSSWIVGFLDSWIPITPLQTSADIFYPNIFQQQYPQWFSKEHR